ncbi:MAG TPA: M3 family metallopeptidase, partial [Allocoleopsis sp.]
KYELNKKFKEKYEYNRYHLYAPLANKTTEKYDYIKSKELVLDTYRKFDERFYLRAKKFFDEKHIHSHPSISKRGGAFCQSITKDLTPYLLLNHKDTMNDVYTMIHELGHGIHDLFSAEKQVDLLRHASLPICETASIFSEMILSDRMLKESKDNIEKINILTQLLDNQYATIHRQAYFIIFEKYAHDAIMHGATKEELDETYYSLLKEQFGDMKIPEEFKSEWNYIPHIHETPFYCYAYAWGNLFVLALFDMYRKEGKKFIDKYVELLQSGGNGSPSELMKKLGADPESEEFWQRGFNIIKEEIEELKKLK